MNMLNEIKADKEIEELITLNSFRMKGSNTPVSTESFWEIIAEKLKEKQNTRQDEWIEKESFYYDFIHILIQTFDIKIKNSKDYTNGAGYYINALTTLVTNKQFKEEKFLDQLIDLACTIKAQDAVRCLKNLPEQWRTKKNGVLCSILIAKNPPSSLKYGNLSAETINQHIDIYIPCIKRDFLLLGHIPHAIDNYEKLCKTIIDDTKNDAALRCRLFHIPQEKRSQELCLFAINLNPGDLAALPSAIIENKEQYYQCCHVAVNKRGDTLQYVKADKLTEEQYLSLCKDACENDFLSLFYLSTHHMNEKEHLFLWERSLSQHPSALDLMSQHPAVLKLIAHGIRGKDEAYYQLCHLTVSKKRDVLQHVKVSQFTEEQYLALCQKACEKDALSVRYVLADCMVEKEFEHLWEQALSTAPSLLEFIPHSIMVKNEKYYPLCHAAVGKKEDLLTHVKGNQLTEEQYLTLCKQACEKNASLVCDVLSNAMSENEFYFLWEQALSSDPSLLEFIPHGIMVKNERYYPLCHAAIGKKEDVLQHVKVDQITKEQYLMLCKKACEKDALLVRYVLAHHMIEKEFELLWQSALSNDPSVLEVIPKDVMIKNEQAFIVLCGKNTSLFKLFPESIKIKYIKDSLINGIIDDNIYLEIAGNLAERIDFSWAAYKDQSSSYRAYALKFLIYALDLTHSKDMNAQLNQLMAERQQYKKTNPSYIPGKSPFITSFHAGLFVPKKTTSFQNSNTLEMKKAFNSMELLDVNNGSKEKDIECKIKMLKQEEQNPYQVHIYNGAFYKNGQVFSSTDMVSHRKRGYAAFILTSNGELRLFNHYEVYDENNLTHASMNDGAPVFAAGEVKIEQGILKEITTHCGHYWPSLYSTYKVLEYFKEKNVSIEHVDIISSKADAASTPRDDKYVTRATQIYKTTDNTLKEKIKSFNEKINIYCNQGFIASIFQNKVLNPILIESRGILLNHLKDNLNSIKSFIENLGTSEEPDFTTAIQEKTLQYISDAERTDNDLSAQFKETPCKRLASMFMLFKDGVGKIDSKQLDERIKAIKNLRTLC